VKPVPDPGPVGPVPELPPVEGAHVALPVFIPILSITVNTYPIGGAPPVEDRALTWVNAVYRFDILLEIGD